MHLEAWNRYTERESTMNKGRIVFAVVTSTTLAGVGLAALGACSSSTDSTSSSSGALPTPDSSKPAVTPTDASTPDTFVPATDAGAECGTPAKLFVPKPDGGIFCPFSATTTGGKDIYCLETEQCCENAKGTGASTCVAKGTACPVATATVWECEDPSNCPASQKCCAHSSAAGTAVTVGTDTCGPFLSKFAGTKCAAACTADELVVCEQDSECTMGTCTAVKPKGNDIGVCH
jgi:hypothetical protein